EASLLLVPWQRFVTRRIPSYAIRYFCSAHFHMGVSAATQAAHYKWALRQHEHAQDFTLVPTVLRRNAVPDALRRMATVERHFRGIPIESIICSPIPAKQSF